MGGGGLGDREVGRGDRGREGNLIDPNMTTTQVNAHQLFTCAVVDLCNIVGHTCATERHGKGYKLIHTPTRPHMISNTLNRAMFVYNNYNLVHESGQIPFAIDDFAAGFLTDTEKDQMVAEEACGHYRMLEGSGADSDSDSDRDEEEDGEGSGEEVEESIPDFPPSGFTVAEK